MTGSTVPPAAATGMKKRATEDEIDRLLALDLTGQPYLPPSHNGIIDAIGKRSANPVVFLEIAVVHGLTAAPAHTVLGRLYIELRRDLVPIAASNFMALCNGEKGYGADGVRYHYKGTKIHRIVKNVVCQGKDRNRSLLTAPFSFSLTKSISHRRRLTGLRRRELKKHLRRSILPR